MNTTLKILNKVNGANEVIFEYAKKLTDNPVAVLMGIAYGGEVEGIAQMWKDCGKVYGFDTFEDKHPSHLSSNKDSFPARCMDHWYNHKDYGTDELRYEYQRCVLDSLGLSNAILIKGEVNKDSCGDIEKIDLAFLDMDMVESMSTGFEAVKDKIVEGGYLFLHDCQNITEVGDWCREVVMKDKRFKKIDQWDRELLTGFKRNESL
jgi:hypothetical protein